MLMKISQLRQLVQLLPVATAHSHTSLKSACPTRWNSTLYMIESVVQLKREAHNALKRIGRVDLCLRNDELDFLSELITFFEPFKDLTKLFSYSAPTLSAIPLMKMRIRKNCSIESIDDPIIKLTKEAVLAKIDERFPETDAVKLHQLLDPETKALIPRLEATRILEYAIPVACERHFMNTTDSGNSQLHSNSTTAASSLATLDEDDADARRKRMRLELLNDLKCQTTDHRTESMV